MITVSEEAKNKIISLLQEENKSLTDTYIHVGVKSGGCSGLSYVLEFIQHKNETDELYQDKGVQILIDKKSLLYVAGTTLEYSGGLNGKGFVFNNPNAQRTCGCGESFSL